MTFQKQEIIQQSALGVVLKGGQELGTRAKVQEIKRSEVRNSWRPPYGTRAEYPDNYNEATVSLLSEGVDPVGIDLVFRAYNEGVACGMFFVVGEESSGVAAGTDGVCLARRGASLGVSGFASEMRKTQ